MDDSVNELIHFLVWPLPETARGFTMQLPRGCLTTTHYVIRSSIPLAEARFFRQQKVILTRPPAVVTAKKTKKRYAGCLLIAHAVQGVFYSVVANRRQPNLYIVI